MSRLNVAGFVLRLFSFSIARSDSANGAPPGGAERHFWEPEYIASTPHLSIMKGTPPSEQTVSTSSKVPVRLQTSPRPASDWWTPVDDSPCRCSLSGVCCWWC